MPRLNLGYYEGHGLLFAVLDDKVPQLGPVVTIWVNGVLAGFTTGTLTTSPYFTMAALILSSGVSIAFLSS